jgi:hypothetical protein
LASPNSHDGAAIFSRGFIKILMKVRKKYTRRVLVPLEGLQAQIYHALRNQYAGAFVLSRRETLAPERTLQPGPNGECAIV